MKTVPQENAPEPRSVGGFVLWFFVGVMLYVLSTGPIVRLMLDGKIPEKAVTTIYAPIEWLSKTSVGGAVMKPFFRWFGEGLWGWRPPK